MLKLVSQIIVLTLFIIVPGVFVLSCKEEEQSEYTPDFSYQVSDEDPNILRFINTTSGDQEFMQWDFGNGEQTNKQPVNRLTYSIFYPSKGAYPVTLTIWGEDKSNRSVTKTVNIEYSVPDPDFEYEIISGSPNLLKLTDVSTGDYDNVTWSYPGREFPGTPGEVRILYLAMGGKYDIELKISRDQIFKTISKEITILSDDPDYLDHYELVWSDEFNGDTIDHTEWVHETGASGWGNDELQTYTDGQNTTVSDGTLKITAEKIGTGQDLGDYTSSRINSTESFTYGRFEVRAKMPEYKGAGLWPALWMLGRSIQEGTSWPLCGEIDIMEYVSWNPDHFSSAIHTESNNHTLGNAITTGYVSLPAIEEEFHTYGLIWTYTYLKFYLDNLENIILTYNKPGTYNQDNWPFDKPFYFLFNIAVGGTYGGLEGVDDEAFPAVMEIDYVHVYQLNETGM